MHSFKAWLASFVIICLALFASVASAAEMWVKGTHYVELPVPVETRNTAKIEVLELFWYGCPHCYELNKLLPAWEKTLAEDVDFHLMPTMFPGWEIHANAFYAAEFLGVLDKLHQPLFDKIAVNPKAFQAIDDFKPIFVANGVSAEDYEKVFKAEGFRKISKVEEAMNSAKKRMKEYRISGVPVLIINGKYRVGAREAGSLENMLKVASFLVQKERAAKTNKAP